MFRLMVEMDSVSESPESEQEQSQGYYLNQYFCEICEKKKLKQILF